MRPPAPSSNHRSHARGFTLLEVLVVILVLSLLASVAVPRLTNLTTRRFDLVATQVADMMMVLAQRDLSGSTPVGLKMDLRADGTRQLVLMALRADDPTDGLAEAEWQRDRFVQPVLLPAVVDPRSVQLIVDDEVLDIAERPFTHVPGDRRPRLTMLMQSASGDQRAVITLEPYAIGPSITLGDRRETAFSRQPIDLDAEGLTREDW